MATTSSPGERIATAAARAAEQEPEEPEVEVVGAMEARARAMARREMFFLGVVSVCCGVVVFFVVWAFICLLYPFFLEPALT